MSENVPPPSKRGRKPGAVPRPTKPKPTATRVSKSDFLQAEQEFNRGVTKKNLAITEEQYDLLTKLYFKDKTIFGLGRDRIFDYLQRKHPDTNVTQRQVNRFLKSLEVAQLFHPKKETTDIAVQIMKKPLERLEADLLDLSNKASGGYKWLLVVVDTFSKLAIAYPMKDKKEATVSKNLKSVLTALRKFPHKPKSILTDNGSEFINQTVEKMLKREGIKHIYTKAQSTSSHAKMVERFNGYLRKRITMWNEQFNTNNWQTFIKSILKSYNETKQRVTGVPPIELVMEQDEGRLQETHNRIRKVVLPKNRKNFTPYEVGDHVRIKIQIDDSFEKPTNNISYTRQVYRIWRVRKPKSDTVLQPGYQIETLSGTKVREIFFHNDLLVVQPSSVSVTAPEKFIVQRILEESNKKDDKTSKVIRMLLVKWKGYAEATWEPFSSIEADVPKMVKRFLQDKAG